jgi:hypothetical protein
VLFGLIMALTFTGSLSAATAARDEVRTLLVAAFSCNVAWGLVDAVMYLLTTVLERGQGLRTLREIRDSGDPGRAREALRGAFPPVVADVLLTGELDDVRRRLLGQGEPPRRPRLSVRDLRGALGVFLLVTLATVPVAVPFLFVERATVALRISNGVALLLLFGFGCAMGHHAGLRPVRAGLAMLAAGTALVVLTIALGG